MKSPIPNILVKDRAVQRALDTIKEAIEVNNGQRGDPLDRGITLRDLVNIGGARVLRGLRTGQALTSSDVSMGQDVEPDALPGQPVGFMVATNYMSAVCIWEQAENPLSVVAELFRATVDSFASASLIGRDQGTQFTDRTVEPGQTYYYWLRFATNSGIEGPLHSTSGFQADVPLSSGAILEEISGEIQQSHLHTVLSQGLDDFDSGLSALTDGLTQEGSTLEQSIASLVSDASTGAAGVESIQTAFTDEGSTFAASATNLRSDASTGAAGVSEIKAAFTDEASTFAVSVSNLKVATSNNTASVQTLSEATVDATEGPYAMWAVSATVNDMTAAIGLFNNGVKTSVGINASEFYVFDSGATDPDAEKLLPFVIVDGVVHMNVAMIKDASIDEGQIGPIGFGKLVDAEGNSITTLAGLLKAEAIDVDNLVVSEATAFTGDVSSTGVNSDGDALWEIKQDGSVTFRNISAYGSSAGGSGFEVGAYNTYAHTFSDGGSKSVTASMRVSASGTQSGIDIEVQNGYGLFIHNTGDNGDALRVHSDNNDAVKASAYTANKAAYRAVNKVGPQIIFGNGGGGTGGYVPSNIFEGSVFPEVIIGGILATRNDIYYGFYSPGLEVARRYRWVSLLRGYSATKYVAGDPIVL